MVLTPDAGTVKTGEARTVPIHEHLIEQGFLDFVKARGQGAIFYRRDASEKQADLLNPKTTRPVILRMELAAWARKAGITDKGVSPNHSWRHTFKKIADKAGISERTSTRSLATRRLQRGGVTVAPTWTIWQRRSTKFPRYKIGSEVQ